MLCRGCVSRWLFASIRLLCALCLDVVYVHFPVAFPASLAAPRGNTRDQGVQRLNKFPLANPAEAQPVLLLRPKRHALRSRWRLTTG
jgi:hypothetical protein